MKTLYSIQGIIFQHGHVFGTAQKPGIGTAVTINDAIIFAMFHGIVGRDQIEPDMFCGQMNDKWGASDITEFQLSDTELKFKKCYRSRPEIQYLFTQKEGDVWIGEYSGRDCGRGQTKCIITPITESFFEYK